MTLTIPQGTTCATGRVARLINNLVALSRDAVA